MAAVLPERIIDDEFTELDRLEVIESSELKLSGSYHSYTYKAAEDTGDLPIKG
ncbi:hypothetical protein SAMN05444920_114162 [Nonomuraea solani]|uniref:Uncharacterized protein n=1 Tax=Nonomuraea solani TaxID=1144553 RepID=A0A1H6ES99_9ACTN|nr:hypothetical protein [Nonomuraea solani]SEG99886.1 hypothetical protein SAMN05444920_114162 [Nonomuraea solani]